jgi:hypothetical protein
MFRIAIFSTARRVLVASILLLGHAFAVADDGLKVTNVWAKSTAPGQNVAAAYLDIASNTPAVLLRAESPAASLVELHEMKIDGNVMKMRAVTKIDVPGGKEVKLEPGGFHVMLIGIRKPLKVGEMVPLTLVFDVGGKTEKVNVNAEVMDAKGTSHHH